MEFPFFSSLEMEVATNRSMAAESDRAYQGGPPEPILYQEAGVEMDETDIPKVNRYSSRLDWFAVDLKGEHSAMDGQILEEHTEYVVYAIHRILDKYKKSRDARETEGATESGSLPNNVILIEPGSQTEQPPTSAVFWLEPKDGFRFLTISVAPSPTVLGRPPPAASMAVGQFYNPQQGRKNFSPHSLLFSNDILIKEDHPIAMNVTFGVSLGLLPATVSVETTGCGIKKHVEEEAGDMDSGMLGSFENSYIPENPRTPPISYISQTVISFKKPTSEPSKTGFETKQKTVHICKKKSLHICKVFGKKKVVFSEFFFATGLIFERFLAPRSRFFEKVNGLCKLRCFPPVALAWDPTAGIHVFPNLYSRTIEVDSSPVLWSSTHGSEHTNVLLLVELSFLYVDPHCSYKTTAVVSLAAGARRIMLLYSSQIIGFAFAVVFFGLLRQANALELDLSIRSLLFAVESNLKMPIPFHPFLLPCFIPV
ncbi:hypothetical protein LXL04_030138 [Taraxacum kok-saghyz]